MKLKLGIAFVLALVASVLVYCGTRPAAATPEAQRGEQLVREAQSAANEKRLSAVRALGEMKYEPAVDTLVRILPDARPDIRMALLWTLKEIASPKSAKPLEPLLKEDEWEVRKATIEALGAIGSPDSVPALAARLQDANFAVAMAAGAALGRIGAPSLDALTDAAQGPPAAERRARLAALQKELAEPPPRSPPSKPAPPRPVAVKPNPKPAEAAAAKEAQERQAKEFAKATAAYEAAAREFTEAKAAREAKTSEFAGLQRMHTQICQAVSHALGHMQEPRALPPLRQMLSDPLPAIRLAAAEALCQQRDTESVAALTDLLKDSSPEVRQGTLKALPKLGDAALPAFLRLATEGLCSQRLVAVKFLSASRDPRCLPVLFAAQGDSETGVRNLAGAALAGVPKEQLVPLACEAVRQPQSPVRQRALAILAQARDPKSADAVAAVLEDRDLALRMKAAEILHALGDARGAGSLAAALKEPNPSFRFTAAEVLVRWGDARGAEYLAAVLKDPDPARCLSAAEQLARCGDARGAEVLLDVVRNGPDEEPGAGKEPRKKPRAGSDLGRVASAYILLGQLGDQRVAEYALPNVKGLVPGLLGPCAQTLGQLKDPRLFDLITPLLVRPGFAGRSEVINALGFLGDPRAVPLLVELAKGLDPPGQFHAKIPGRPREGPTPREQEHFENWLAPHIARALARIGGDQAVEGIIYIVETSPAHILPRFEELCRTMGEMGDPRFVKALVNLLLHDCPEPTLAALNALKKMGPKAIPPLIRELKEPDVARHSAVTSALADLGAPAVDPLLAALKDPEPSVRHGAAWALGQMGEKRAVEPLLEMVSDADPQARASVAWALGRLKDPRAVEPLLKMLRDAQVVPRAAAADALGQLGDRRAIPPLEALAQDPDQKVAQEARRALQTIANPPKPTRTAEKTAPAPTVTDP